MEMLSVISLRNVAVLVKGLSFIVDCRISGDTGGEPLLLEDLA